MFICLNAERGSVGVSEYALGEVTLEQMFIELVRRAESDSDNDRPAFLQPALQVPAYSAIDPALLAQGQNAPYQLQTASNPLLSGFAQKETTLLINQGGPNQGFAPSK